MNKLTSGPRRSFLYAAVILALACTVISVTAWSANSSPVKASHSGLSSLPTLVNLQSYAQVQIAKPTYTPAPTSINTNTVEPTAIPGIISAVIVTDTLVQGDTSQTSSQAPPSPSYDGGKYILVIISEQHLYAYQGDTLVFSFVASTGIDHATRIGKFSVLDKIPNAYGATWNIWMPEWLGIYWSGSLENGIHALPILPNGQQLWAGYLGSPISFGCVVLGANEAQMLYNWADVGTSVEIRQ